MTKSHAIKLSGWAFMLASFGFIGILNDSMAASRIALEISPILLLVGMLGLRAGYADRVGSFGRNMLVLGVLGMVLAFVCGGVLYRRLMSNKRAAAVAAASTSDKSSVVRRAWH